VSSGPPSFGGALNGGFMKSGSGLAHGLGAKLTPLDEVLSSLEHRLYHNFVLIRHFGGWKEEGVLKPP